MTKNFPDGEVTCKCGCGMLPEQAFMDRVQHLRNVVGFALPVTSGARCPAYNEKVAQSGPTGPHTTGRAIDIAVAGPRAYYTLHAAMSLGFVGIGIGKNFIHLDMCEPTLRGPRPTLWTY